MRKNLALSIAFTGIFILLFVNGSMAQHPALYSQYLFNHLVVNPAYTGSRDVLSLAGLYRHQWTGFRGAPVTQTFSMHSPLRDARNNLGIMVFNDKLGVTQNTAIFGSYAFRIPLGERSRLAFGLQGGLAFYQDRWSTLNPGDASDIVFQADSPLFLVPRAGFGIYYDSDKFYFGISTPQILQYESNNLKQYNSNSLLYKHYFLSAGYLFKLNPDLYLRPSVMVKYVKNSPVQGDVNAFLIIRDMIWAGLGYRSGDALVGLVQWQINKQFRIGYSYDQALTVLRRYNSGSHELFIRYEFGYGIRAMSPRYF